MILRETLSFRECRAGESSVLRQQQEVTVKRLDNAANSIYPGWKSPLPSRRSTKAGHHQFLMLPMGNTDDFPSQ